MSPTLIEHGRTVLLAIVIVHPHSRLVSRYVGKDELTECRIDSDGKHFRHKTLGDIHRDVLAASNPALRQDLSSRTLQQCTMSTFCSKERATLVQILSLFFYCWAKDKPNLEGVD